MAIEWSVVKSWVLLAGAEVGDLIDPVIALHLEGGLAVAINMDLVRRRCMGAWWCAVLFGIQGSPEVGIGEVLVGAGAPAAAFPPVEVLGCATSDVGGVRDGHAHGRCCVLVDWARCEAWSVT